MPKLRIPGPRSVLYFGGDEGGRRPIRTVGLRCDHDRSGGAENALPGGGSAAVGDDVGAFLRGVPPGGQGRPLFFVRVRAIATGYTLRDLSAVLCEGLSGVLLPKVTGPADVIALDALLTCLETERGRVRGSTLIYPILETAEAIRRAYKIAKASKRVAYMGGAVSDGDIQQNLGYRWTPEGRESLFIRSKVSVDARAAGVRYPISGMWAGRLDDLDGLRRFANELRDIGYYGMLLNSSIRSRSRS